MAQPLSDPRYATLVAGLVFVAGCAQEPTRLSPPASTKATATPVPAPRKAPEELLQAAVATAPSPFEGEGWQPLFDGKSLAGWHETDFAGHGELECRLGLIILNMGDPFTGVTYTNPTPKINYEIALDAMLLMGSDFFCGLTVPVRDSFCSLIVGGWGGSLVGISSLDSLDASENGTAKFIDFKPGRWYRIRLRISETKLQAWIDNEKLIDVDTTDKKISLRPGEIELSKPFGLASYNTTAAYREIKLRKL